MKNAIIVVLLILAVGGACAYICRKKKAGAKCIGCPYEKTSCCCCHMEDDEINRT